MIIQSYWHGSTRWIGIGFIRVSVSELDAFPLLTKHLEHPAHPCKSHLTISTYVVT